MKRGVMLLLLLAVFCCGCSKGEDFEAGRSYSGLEIAVLQDELRAELDREPELITGVYYFTASGSVYHRDPQCSFLARSKEVLSGSMEDVAARGIQKPCSRCGGE